MCVCECECECISFFSWHLRGDLYEMTEKRKREKQRKRVGVNVRQRMQKSKWNGRFENEIFKFHETTDTQKRNTHGTPYMSAILVWSGVYGMQSENEMCVCVCVNTRECGSDSYRSLSFYFFFCFISTLYERASVDKKLLVGAAG